MTNPRCNEPLAIALGQCPTAALEIACSESFRFSHMRVLIDLLPRFAAQSSRAPASLNLRARLLPAFCFPGTPIRSEPKNDGSQRKHSRLRLGAMPLASGCPRNEGRQKWRIEMNQLTIIGFTGNEAEAHYTPSGTLIATISVATKES